MTNPVLLDCTFRDGGYYNNWDFPPELISSYLSAMASASVDVVELGFRSFSTKGYRGPCAYTTDRFLRGLTIPSGLSIGVMANASELVSHALGPAVAITLLFDRCDESPVDLVRIACHIHEVGPVLPACDWLVKAGYRVGLNLMQVADRTEDEIEAVAALVADTGIEVLYFADSMGSLDPGQTARIIHTLRRRWHGPMGIHTHDNMGCAIANTLRAMKEGVTWVDSTVTGMGRGPGNAQTEYLAIELEKLAGKKVSLTPLLELIRKHFLPLRARHGWGKNPFYYLAGQYGIHPTFVQEMLADPRYDEAEILAVIEHLRRVGGKRFSESALEAGRQGCCGDAIGSWNPATVMEDREVLIIGSGPSAHAHRGALQQYVAEQRPYVIALNTQVTIDPGLIDARAACHPIRLLVDCETYRTLPQALIVPVDRLDNVVRESLPSSKVYDFGLTVQAGTFRFDNTSAVVPTLLVVAYALAVATSGKACRILLAGFDGYSSDDPRNIEMDELLSLYQAAEGACPLLSVTPTKYAVPSTSIYAL